MNHRVINNKDNSLLRQIHLLDIENEKINEFPVVWTISRKPIDI